MKATYQKPELNIFLLDINLHLMAGSATLGDNPAAKGIDLSLADETDEVGGNLSRTHTVWDDTEDY